MYTLDIKVDNPFNPGTEIEQRIYLNLTRNELLKMLSAKDPEDNPIARMSAARTMTGVELYDTLRALVLAAYGVPNASRTGLRKNEKLREDFEGSAFFDEVMDIVSGSEDAAIAFFKGIVPPKMDINKIIANAQKEATEE